MTKKPALKERVLVLCLGGTMNGDWRDTEQITLGHDKPATNITVYRDDKGRMPAQIYIEDVLNHKNVTFHELAAKDSKALTHQDKQVMLDEILTAEYEGYDRVLVIMGTDTATETGALIEKSFSPDPGIPVILVTAMAEMTRDMDLETNRFITYKTDGIRTLEDALSDKLKAGVHIMTANAGYAPPSHVEKDFSNKRFLARSPKR